ncbi:MAG TPA: carboxypeptidase regulatory-like domain-containing protein [Vicinamibacterales bacterium]
MTISYGSALIAVFLASAAAAQPPPAQQPPPTRPRPRAVQQTPPSQVVVVRDFSGALLEGVRVVINGPRTVEATTDRSGSARTTLADGSYRLHLERQGFVTLERDVTIKTGRPAEIDVALTAAPPPPPPPEPPPPTPPIRPMGPSGPSGPPVILSIPAFLDKNFIGRDPLKESVLGCTPDVTTRLLQLHDALASHRHADLDEVLYVVAGDGVVRVQDRQTPIAAGALTVIPRGVSHEIERRGKNPLILLSMLAGAPCQTAAVAARDERK